MPKFSVNTFHYRTFAILLMFYFFGANTKYNFCCSSVKNSLSSARTGQSVLKSSGKPSVAKTQQLEGTATQYTHDSEIERLSCNY